MHCPPVALHQPHPTPRHRRHLWPWLPVLAAAVGLSILLLAAHGTMP
ncbi:hypothetical protein [uncultured Thiodictyon sp.]|nr:hypothetical protein [uncultured Thiodictyon sp.]